MNLFSKNPIRKYIAFVFLYFGWGSLYFAIRMAIETIPPFLLAGSSSVISALILMLLSRSGWPSWGEWKAAALPAFFMIVLGNGAVVWAEQVMPSSVTALILATEPAWLILLDRAFFKGPKPNVKIWSGIFLGVAGVGILMMGELSAEASRAQFLVGVVVLLVAALGWSAGSLMCRSERLPKNSAMAMALPVLMGGCALLGVSCLSGEIFLFQWSRVSSGSAAAYIYIVMVSYVVAYWSYIWLLKNVRLSQVSTYAYVTPLLAVCLGVFLGGEKLSGSAVIGGAVIIVAVFLILQNEKKETVS